MNILFITNHLNVGGISSYLLTLTSGLKQKGHQIYLASSGGELEGKFIQAGITLFKVPLKTKNEISYKILLSFWKLRSLVLESNIDLIHSHSRTTQVLADLLSRVLGKPHVFTCHGFFKPKIFRQIFGCWGQRIIAVSQQVKEHLIKDFKLNKFKISVVCNGVDIKNFGDSSNKDKLRRQLSISTDFFVGIIARLSDVKGHTYLIQAMSEVIKEFPQSKLLIVGQGKTKDALTRQVNDLGLEASILFIPEIEDTKNLLVAMDIFVMPSLQEGLGLALMEAMAQGIPVVGSAVGGIKTLIQDKKNGLLVAPADSAALAGAIITLLNDAALRRALGGAARKFIIDNFSKEKMVNETEIVYQQVLAGMDRPGSEIE